MRNNQGRNIDVQNLGKSALVISNAVRLALTEVLVDLVRQNKLRMDSDGNYIYDYHDVDQVVHSQALIVDDLTPDWWTVSFVGKPEFLEMIESEGWESSITSVRNFLIASGAEIDFDLSKLDYYPVGHFNKTAEEDSLVYTVVVNTSEDKADIRDLAESVGLEVLTNPEEETITMNQNTNTASNGDAFDQAVHSIKEGVKDGAAKAADSVASAAESVKNAAEDTAEKIREDGAASAEVNQPWYKRKSTRFIAGEVVKTAGCYAGVVCLASLAIRAIWAGVNLDETVEELA